MIFYGVKLSVYDRERTFVIASNIVQGLIMKYLVRH